MGHFEHHEDPCLHCGACFSYCLWDRFEQQNPGKDGSPELCRKCMVCYNICARAHPADAYPEPELFAGAAEHPSMGRYRAMWSGYATDRKPGAQDGGVTTVLLQTMMAEGMIGGALVVGRNEVWQPVAVLATTGEEISRAMGSKYTTFPAPGELSKAMEGCQRLAVVTLPCQTTPLRYLMHKGNPDFSPEKIVAILGIFCYESFRYEGIRALVEEQHQLPMAAVSRFDIKKNRLQFFEDGGEGPRGAVPLAEVKRLSWPICHSCIDFTAELADVSLGAVGSRLAENTVLVRTPRGQEIVDLALEKGLIRLEPIRNLALLERLAGAKRKRKEELSPEDARFLLKQTLRGNYKKLKLKGEW